MKVFMLLAAGLVITGEAIADRPLSCQSPDRKYQVTLNLEELEGELTVDGNPVEFGEVTCAEGDGLFDCLSLHAGNAGYHISLEPAGDHKAGQLGKFSPAGETPLASLKCDG